MEASTMADNTEETSNTQEESGGSDRARPAVMRAVVARSYGEPDVMSVEQIPVPAPGPQEVLVEVEASSLNALDWHYLTGTPYFMRAISGVIRPKRTTPGADVAGTVVETGSQVTRFEPGDRVFGECRGGGCASFVIVNESSIVAIPEDVDSETAGATPVAGLTALQGLRTHADVQPGDQVLINGAAGGVGTFAVQIAVALGAEVTAVCSSRNVEMVRSLGASEVFDYSERDFVEGGARFDVMLDNVGNRSAAECLAVLRPSGRYVAVSGPKDNRLLGPVPDIFSKALAFRRASQSFHQFTATPDVEDLEYLGHLLATGAVVPQVDRVIGLDRVANALAEIGTGHARAKIVVVPDRAASGQ